ncbi:MAG: 1-deoxy-D-xylulose-5-phosphate synthase [Opitutae bacterium]|nr:1-deoxy-D-xylulose-5-phosphate synthase [Opitutae bacterium]
MSSSPSVPTLLSRIAGPADVKALAPAQLPQLAQEIRDELINVTAKNGGHVGPNLGVVELTIALHRVFHTPDDQIVFDVAHQGYVHKLLTGRQGEFFHKLRKTGGASGFLSRPESPHDAFGAGHAGTALSAALGMATARDLRGTNEHVVAVCGDAAFTCGVTLEALNNVVGATKRLVVILNDNEWSIARNVGAIASYLSSLFEKFGLRYHGPVDGHNIDTLVKNLEFARDCDVPVLIHVLTKKGKGLDAAVNAPEKFHGVSPFDPETGESLQSAPGLLPNFQDVLGAALTRFAKQDPKVLGITAAMPAGTGLSLLAREVPGQFFDVGIAEEHAVLFAAGLATKGFRPVCAIYSTFLQRAYDMVIHDVALQNLPVTFCLDRAGLSPNDGPTHHGLFDLAYLRCVPNATVMQPKDEDELVDMLHTALHLPGPAFIRYPRGAGPGAAVKAEPAALPVGAAELLREGSNIMIWALGPMVQEAQKVAERLAREEGISVGVVNARFVKPLDRTLLLGQAAVVPLLVTMEDHVLAGGFGSAVLEALQESDCPTPVERIGWPDRFVEHGSNVDVLRAAGGLSTDDITRRIRDRYRRLGAVTAEAEA